VVPVLAQQFDLIDILAARPQQEDIDGPLINIFDEERLCRRLLWMDPAAAWEVCRLPLFRNSPHN
jgi:hypothetical protein